MKTVTTFLVSVIAVVIPVFAIHGQAHTTYPKGSYAAPDTLVVVVLGSSTAAGSGASPRDSAWAYRYRDYLETYHAPAQLYNIARGGYTSYHLQPDWYAPPDGRYAPDSARNISRALRYKPDALIINLPSNDAARNYTLEEQQENFERLARVCDSVHIPFWLSTTQPRNFSDSQRQNLIMVRDWLLIRFGTQTVNFWDGIALEDGTILPLYNSGDGVHLNNAGHALLYERVVQLDIPGRVRTTSIASRAMPLPEAFAAVVYPNPFTSHTTMSLELRYAAQTTIEINGVLGNVHRTIHSGYLDRGRHTIAADLGDLPPGMYFYSVRSGKEVRFGKFLKIPG